MSNKEFHIYRCKWFGFDLYWEAYVEGKKVEFIPDAADATKARLILSGALVDLSDILGSVAMNSRAGITDLLKFASPGVIREKRQLNFMLL